MDIHGYQAKEILGTYEIPVPRGRVCLTADQVERAAKMMGGHCVVKAQIYAGGRGKAGGVKVVHHPEQAQELAKELFARKLVTPQTGPDGLRVRRILVEEAVEIAREFYLSITARYVVRVDLPGVPPSDVEIEVEETALHVRGERRMDLGVPRDAYLRSERPQGAFAVSLQIPSSVDRSRIEAGHRDGVLEIVLPKRKDEGPARVRVDVK